MNLTSIRPLFFLFAIASVFAQQSVTRDRSKNTSFTHLRTVGAYCPLDMQASHGAGLPIVMDAGPAMYGNPMVGRAPAPPLYQRIHLTMTNLLSHDIVSIQITARGFSDKWKVLDLARSSQAPDLAKTLDVVLDMKGLGRATRDLSLSRFAAVTSIDLNSITYADGTTWHSSAPGTCGIIPDMITLVAAKR